jgi:RNA polymerase sigma-70 factor, ECF subfamily
MGTTTTARSLVSTGAGSQSDEEFTSSYRSSLGQLVGYFRAKGVPREEAADLANESIVRMLVHLKRHGRDRTDLGPLVRTIARNLLVERIRKASPVVVPLVDDMDVADDALEPADQLLATERRDAVRDAIRSLSPRHRHVVGLWMDGRTPVEIARVLGIKRNAVDAILHRARRSLAAKLDGGGVLGVFGVVALRLRMIGRRVGEALASVDPTGQYGPAGLGIAAVGLAAILTVSTPGPSQATPGTGTSHLRATNVGAGQLTRETTKGARGATRTAVGPIGSVPTERKISVGVGDDGGDEGVGLDVGFVRDSEGRRGIIGPIVEDLAVSTCDQTGGACRVSQ